MKDLFLIIAGVLGMLIAVIHGILGEKRVIGSIAEVPATPKRVLQAIMFLSAFYWFCAGAVLVITPAYFEGELRRYVVLITAGIFASGALGNAWATRGKHFGWVLLAVTTGLALLGV